MRLLRETGVLAIHSPRMKKQAGVFSRKVTFIYAAIIQVKFLVFDIWYPMNNPNNKHQTLLEVLRRT